MATLTLVDTHEGFEAFTPEQRQAFVNSRREPLLAVREPRDIADAVARSLVGPKARPEGAALGQVPARWPLGPHSPARG